MKQIFNILTALITCLLPCNLGATNLENSITVSNQTQEDKLGEPSESVLLNDGEGLSNQYRTIVPLADNANNVQDELPATILLNNALNHTQDKVAKSYATAIPLNEGWRFTQQGKDQWYDAQVPGSVQRDLIRCGVLPNPFWGTNEAKIQWVEDENWDFRKTFTLSAEQMQFTDALLCFDGLDTHADVFLNGARILRAENMFVGYKIPVKQLLHEGENRLYIRFYSPITAMLPARETFGYDYPADNDHRAEKMSVYTRKAPYHFGWDWGIRIVQMGIWKPVTLLLFNNIRIEDYYVKQTQVTKEKAEVENIFEIFSSYDKPQKAELNLLYNMIASSCMHSVSKNVELQPGKNIISIPITIDKPYLWMPKGTGIPYIYNFGAYLKIDNKEVARASVSTGLRSVRLVREADKYGKSYYFEVNGIPVFAKGANYIPGEIFTSQQDSAYYARVFENITAANMNMIRVWGGGIYENDEFYTLADMYGILVWQDFIFGCTTYPTDAFFLQNIKDEAIYNIKRLRNHPSLAFWCGNNEILEGMRYWGWDKRVPKQIMSDWYAGYDRLFQELLPSLVEEYDGTRSYVHGSPYTGNWGHPELFNQTDAHDWGLWYGHLPFEGLADRLPRFASEFGFQSFPEMKTIRSFAPEDQWSLESEVMTVHQKASTGNSLIKQYMDMYYHKPNNFEDFVYLGLVMQGNGMEESIEAMRRGRPYCMGAFYWQINDSWPVVSWSSIDYYNNWKAQHYKVRNVYAPLALGVKLNNDTLSYYTMSDYLDDFTDLTLEVNIVDFERGITKALKDKVTAKANASLVVKAYNVDELVPKTMRNHTMIRAFLKNKKGEIISSKDYFFYWPINLDLPQPKIEMKVKYEDGRYVVRLHTDKLAKDLFIEIPTMGARFSDNFFNLLPGETKVVVITSPNLKAADHTKINLRHVRQTY